MASYPGARRGRGGVCSQSLRSEMDKRLMEHTPRGGSCSRMASHRSARKSLKREGRKTEGFCGIITGKEKSGVIRTNPNGKEHLRTLHALL